jgi:DNA-directed RNA polymerase II subunit RPB2
MLGWISSTSPFPEHNQAPRNIYSFTQMKKVIQVPYINNNYSLDKKYYLVSQERSLLTTITSEVTRHVSNPFGHNLLVAINMNKGF